MLIKHNRFKQLNYKHDHQNISRTMGLFVNRHCDRVWLSGVRMALKPSFKPNKPSLFQWRLVLRSWKLSLFLWLCKWPGFPWMLRIRSRLCWLFYNNPLLCQELCGVMSLWHVTTLTMWNVVTDPILTGQHHHTLRQQQQLRRQPQWRKQQQQRK